MKISIFKKQILFSHKVKTSFLLPRTSYKVTLWPTRLQLENLQSPKDSFEMNMVSNGLIENFLPKLDLEKDHVEFSGKGVNGFFRFIIKEENGHIILLLKNGPESGIQFENKLLLPKQFITLISNIEVKCPSYEKISFGSHKALDVQKIGSRKDLQEIIPIWFSLSQKIAYSGPSHREGCAKYLDFPEGKKELEKHFVDFFQAGFKDFCPRLFDEYQGFLNPKDPIDPKASSLLLLKELGLQIRSLFFRQEENTLFILEKLLQPFHCGRMIHIQCNHLGTMDLEWSKKRIKKVIFYPKKSGEITLFPPKEIKSYRVRYSRNDKGKIISSGDSLQIEESKILFLDQFEK